MSEGDEKLVEALEFVLTEYHTHSDADTACIEHGDKDHEIWKRVTAALAAAKSEAAPPAVWSRERPTEEGWYWWRFNKGEPHASQIVEKYGELYDISRDQFLSVYVESCEWAGPLRPPVEGPR